MTVARLGHPYREENGISWFGYRHARDIPDTLFLQAIDVAKGVWARNWAMRSDVARVLGGLPIGQDVEWVDEVPGVPGKVVLAKFKRVKGRGLVDGCDCGCRGDFELTEKGRAQLMVGAT